MERFINAAISRSPHQVHCLQVVICTRFWDQQPQYPLQKLILMSVNQQKVNAINKFLIDKKYTKIQHKRHGYKTYSNLLINQKQKQLCSP